MITNSLFQLNKSVHRLIMSSIRYLFIAGVGLILIYPLIWLFMSSFKPTMEILTGINLFPKNPSLKGYIEGFKGVRDLNFILFLKNSFLLTIPSVLFTLVSSTLVAYGFARFNFKFKKILFGIMLSSLMLPRTVLIIPRYLLFNTFGWLDTYLPFYIPALFATEAFFIFLLVQFFRGIPRELDESAVIDGCNSFKILSFILVPMLKPALFTVVIFKFMWSWNAFLDVFIYISSTIKYTVPIGLRMFSSINQIANMSRILAMTVVSVVPTIIVFFIAQKYFIEGISTSGLKG